MGRQPWFDWTARVGRGLAGTARGLAANALRGKGAERRPALHLSELPPQPGGGQHVRSPVGWRMRRSGCGPRSRAGAGRRSSGRISTGPELERRSGGHGFTHRRAEPPVWRHAGAGRDRSQDRERPHRLPDRTVRLRQVHAAPADRRSRAAHLRRDRPGRPSPGRLPQPADLHFSGFRLSCRGGRPGAISASSWKITA